MENSSGGTGFDGGVLDIKIGAGSFTDILTAVEAFSRMVMPMSLAARLAIPLEDDRLGSGNSGGFVTTVVNLPPGLRAKTFSSDGAAAATRVSP